MEEDNDKSHKSLNTPEVEDSASFLSHLDVKSEELRHSLQAVEHLDSSIDTLFDKLEADNYDYSVPEGYTEVERYFVNEPYAFVSILYNEEHDDYLYYVAESKLNEEEKFLLTEISERLRNVLLFTDLKETGEEGSEEETKEEIIRRKIDEVVKRYLEYDPNLLGKLSYYIIRDFVHFGKIDALMRDRFIEDISCDGYNIPVYVYHWKYGSTRTNIDFDDMELDSFVVKVAQKGGKHLSLSDPLMGITMEDGSRAQLSLGREITTKGSTLTIRKFHDVLISPVDLIRWRAFSAEEMAYLWLCVENGKSILFIGGTASGKTTSLNAVSLFIPQNAKIVTIEDTRELRLPHNNWIPTLTKVSFTGATGSVDMYDLLKAALRQRPEYLLVGEVRGKEALTLFQAMSTGHTSFSTFHADSVDATIHRLEYPPLSVPRSMMQSLDVIAIQTQVFIGTEKTRRNIEISEILGIDPTTKNIKTMKVFDWNPAKDSFEGLKLSTSKILAEIARFNAWSKEQLEEEFESRVKLLTIMGEKEVTPQEFISAVRTFQANPEKVKKQYGI
jgi:flagellar protein FlaI